MEAKLIALGFKYLEKWRRVSKEIYVWGPLESTLLSYWAWRRSKIQQQLETDAKAWKIGICNCRCYTCGYHGD